MTISTYFWVFFITCLFIFVALGMSFNEKEEMMLVWKFCSRGTLQDIIYNDNIALDSKFHAAFSEQNMIKGTN